MTTEVDVVICGSGSAGLAAAVWLARYGVHCTILEKRPGPMQIGQADGVQCRTVEIFESLGIAEELLRESYHVLEVAFWSSPNGKKGISRSTRSADTRPGLSHMPHVILNQARINGLLLERMQDYNNQHVDYGYDVVSVSVDHDLSQDNGAFPVTVKAQKDGKEELFKAKYALACDGAHSAVRHSIGFQMVGDRSDAIWGVMDIYPQTDFPDIRKKCTIRSSQGNLLIIPREGGSLVRFYIELLHGSNADAKTVKLEDLHQAAGEILAPYTLKISETFWWSAYAIGQRLADHFSLDNRVFLTGDSCHTHSPKAGQGMNTSLQDGYNIGWKLASVLTGRAGPELLQTYDLERQKVAADLIDFDRYFTKLFSSATKDDVSPDHFAEQFVKAGSYTAGLTAKYQPSIITSGKVDLELATKIVVGMRFPSAQVVRFCDAKAMQLLTAIPSDGRWRLVIFAGDLQAMSASIRLRKLATYLADGLVMKYTSSCNDIDSFIDPIVVFHGERRRTEQEQIPDYFWPATGKWKIRDLHKTFFDDESYNAGHGHAYEKYGIDPERGAIVILRPDQYVSKILSFDDIETIGTFFKGWALPVK